MFGLLPYALPRMIPPVVRDAPCSSCRLRGGGLSIRTSAVAKDVSTDVAAANVVAVMGAAAATGTVMSATGAVVSATGTVVSATDAAAATDTVASATGAVVSATGAVVSAMDVAAATGASTDAAAANVVAVTGVAAVTMSLAAMAVEVAPTVLR